MWPLAQYVSFTGMRKMPAPVPIIGGTTWKLQLFFNQALFGWSEVYYWNEITDTVDKAVSAANRVGLIRSELIATGTQCVGVRVSKDGSPGVSQLSFSLGKNVPDLVPSTTEYPTTAWLANAADQSSQYKRHFFLRGITTAVNKYSVTKPLNPNVDPDFLKNFETLEATLINILPIKNVVGRFVIRGWAKEAPPRVATTIGYVNVWEPTNTFAIGSAVAIGAVGDTIQLTKFRGAGIKGLNGRARILQIIPAAGTVPQLFVTSRLPRQPQATPILTKPGLAVTSEYRWYPIASVGLERIVSKRVGKPFFGTAGARPAR